jgi:hypothetical protein
VPVDDTFSAVSLVPPSGLYDLLTWFKIALNQIMVLQIIPPIMEDSSIKETPKPLRYFRTLFRGIGGFPWIREWDSGFNKI